MKNWRKEKPVFSKTPDWVTKALPNFSGGSMWAPDISYHNGKFISIMLYPHLAKILPVLVLAVNKTLGYCFR